MHKWNAQWDGLLAWQWHIFTLAEEAHAKEQDFSIKGVNVGTVKIKHNSYGKNITDKMMHEIKKYCSNIMEEENIVGKNVFSPFVFILVFSFLLDNIYGQLIAHFSF